MLAKGKSFICLPASYCPPGSNFELNLAGTCDAAGLLKDKAEWEQDLLMDYY